MMANPKAPKLMLSLLRHAKATRDEPGGGDIARPLTGRGRRNSDAAGMIIAGSNLEPDFVLCSTSTRTRETLELVRPHLHTQLKLVFADSLYLAGPLTLLRHLHEAPKSARHIMVVGHNPGLHALALELVAGGPQDLIGALGRKMPTCALAVMSFGLGSWPQIMAGTGHLLAFNSPSDAD